MKILELRFKNLNSLAGEWLIDFTDPHYEAEGIFALTGPTGAGKSTILDAICLALYGATPRLGRITASNNEIMSRHTGECFAELVFESVNGRFRVRWEQRKARKQVNGKLQAPEHQIAWAQSQGGVEDGQLIASQLSTTAKEVEVRTGMDFERFTRSILLAQGGFDTFLKADSEQKSKILEQITGTEIYSDISRKTHERQKEEFEKLAILKAELSGVSLLTDDEVLQTKTALTELEHQYLLRLRCVDTLKSCVAWLLLIDQLQQELEKAECEDRDIQAQILAFAPHQKRLELAEQAASLEAPFAQLQQLRRNVKEETLNKDQYIEQREKLEQALADQHTQHEQAKGDLIKAEQDHQQLLPLLQSVRALDQNIDIHKQAQLRAQAKIAEQNTLITNCQAQLTGATHSRELLINQLAGVASYAANNKTDEWLIGGLAGIREQLKGFGYQQSILQNTKFRARELTTSFAALQEQLTENKQQEQTHIQGMQQAQQTLQLKQAALSDLLGNRLLREYREQKDTLFREMAFVKKIEALESHRAALQNGKECPLCGALAHPFSNNDVPALSDLEHTLEVLTSKIQCIEQAELDEAKVKDDLFKMQSQLNTIEQSSISLTHKLESTQNDIEEEQNKQQIAQANMDELKLSVLTSLQPMGIKEGLLKDNHALLTSLEDRLKAWQANDIKKAELNAELVSLNTELTKLHTMLEQHNESLAKLNTEYILQVQNKQAFTNQRSEIFGDKIADNEQQRSNDLVFSLQQTEQKVSKALSESKERLAGVVSQLTNTEARIEKAQSTLRQNEDKFTKQRLERSFNTETNFSDAVMPSDDRQALLQQQQTLTNTHTALQAKLEDRKARLRVESAKALTQDKQEVLSPRLAQEEEQLRSLTQQIAANQQRLKSNIEAQQRTLQKQQAIALQNIEYGRWRRLHDLIGSSDGRKFRNFAQGLTFELMIMHANVQLSKMTDRYLLVRDLEQPLELNVEDAYQAGEIRPTKNLSGGETFIISLTLALGLSKMASNKVRVDSLFLDEGFGTLDDDALNTALEVLSTLHGEGKLIGIISHVSSLKDRIQIQLKVRPNEQGRSVLVGPGCSRVTKQKEVDDVKKQENA